MVLGIKEISRWADVTREERHFCADLYCEIKDSRGTFIEILNKDYHPCSQNPVIFPECDDWEIGYEVALCRDLYKADIIDVKRIDKYRKFDLALFLDKRLVLIEAKAQQGFDKKKDLYKINEDKSLLKKKLPDVETTFVALCSSKYVDSCRRETCIEKYFDIVLTWEVLAKQYREANFQRANDIYGK